MQQRPRSVRHAKLNSAFTMVEMLVAMAVMVVLMGILTVTYSHVTFRTASAIATATTVWQAKNLSQDIEDTVQDANSCSLVVGAAHNGLKCIMPANGNTTSAFGVYNSYTPSSATTDGLTHWGQGKRRWYYWAGSTGDFTLDLTSTTMYMAERSDDLVPTSADIVKAWTYYGGGTSTTLRWGNIDTFTFSVNTAANTVTFTIGASDWLATGNANPNPTVLQKQGTRSIALTRTVYWRHSTT